MAGSPAIEVRDAAKSFTVPDPNDSLLARVRSGRPFSGRGGRELEVLREISFDVLRGEFFGIVGQNGSGKSTLLKLIAGIYRLDAGRIRVAGRLAPFLELGVGFDPELPARENVITNGVMMGLTTAEAERRCDGIIDFAGLREHTDLKLKNYSSGMRVRLGFAVMTHVDADVLLVDEVLAVGDAEFREKCTAQFERMHAEGRTIVLVTHSMDAISTYCSRALMLHGGRIDTIGEPGPVTNRYVEVNVAAALANQTVEERETAERIIDALGEDGVRVGEARLEGSASGNGELASGEPIELRASALFEREIAPAALHLRILDADQRLVYERGGIALSDRVGAGDRLELAASLENPLADGRYVLSCWIEERDAGGDWAPASGTGVVAFKVTGGTDRGLVSIGVRVRAERRAGGGALAGGAGG